MNPHSRSSDMTAGIAASPPTPWWRGAVLYQIYPLSFSDGNGDGIGDLVGIANRLDHVADLGVDGVWLSPFFRSPMKDFGYDVSDYRDVEPVFGTLADFDALVARARALGLRVIIDQVWSHTSDQHPWFEDSRSGRDSEKADWYVWADPKPDGSPPNNWLSVFGGPAWTWEPRRRQYYLHHFLPHQPQLNLHHRPVERELFQIARFWIERGVDGFRLDAVDFFFHDPLLPNNPARPPMDAPPLRPFGMQRHLHDMLQTETYAFMSRLNGYLAPFPQVATLAEVSSEVGAYRRCAEYTDVNAQRLDMAYSLALMKEALTAPHFRKVLADLDNAISDGCVCWAFSNHDVVRAVTRWGGEAPPDRVALVLMVLLLTLPGAACLYQGEELGLPEADIAREHMRDPYGINFYPLFKGRDGARTPIPWQQARASERTPALSWLPIPDRHRALAVDVQRADPNSVLAAHRRFLHWRKQQPALRDGAFKVLPSPASLLVYERTHPSQRIVVACNLGMAPCLWPDATAGGAALVPIQDFPLISEPDGTVLPPLSVAIAIAPGTSN